MKYALISDIHGNLEALTTSLDYFSSRGQVDMYICLGDIVGYGADPGACLEIIMNRADLSVIGNHDAAVIGETDINYFNHFARTAVLWTREMITIEQDEYLRALPFSVCRQDLLFTHAAPVDPQDWDYIFNQSDAAHYFKRFNESVCFVGHSHVAGIYGSNGQMSHLGGKTILDPDEQYIINIGSIGQPRNGDPRLSCAFFDSDERSIEIVRLDYDCRAAGKKIIDAGLPAFLAERLSIGR
ncbi:metallophosphoesterase family protein [candidate division KSB1 bacterium]